MTSTIFDDITNAFLTALTAGTLSLGVYSLPLLGAFALIGWYWTFRASLALGGGDLGDALACGPALRREYRRRVLVARQSVWHGDGCLSDLPPVGTGCRRRRPPPGLLLTPSAVVDMGFQIAAPIMDYSDPANGLECHVEFLADFHV